MSRPQPIVHLTDVAKAFGVVRAVRGVSLAIAPGERVGLVGHNGAGKSTLMNLLLGATAPDSGRILIDGSDATGGHDVSRAFAHGIRCVFQELSLCANLTVYENLKLQHASLRGPGWRKRARQIMADTLDEVFPGHGIDVNRTAADLSIGQRQMAEIARAFAAVDAPVRLVILDEPTSSLDAAAAERLLIFLRRASERGIAALFISHRLKEVVSVADRVVVMRDGAVVGDEPAVRVSDHRLVELMSGGVQRQDAQRSAPSAATALKRVVVERGGAPVLAVGEGDVVGLAGLDGHGQRDLLRRIFLARPRSGERIATDGRLAYVSGDRQREGIFPLWSINRNITIGLLRVLSAWGLLRPSSELRTGNQWRERIGIRTPDIQLPILSLSGGNQQKVLIARALASGAALILLDDPTRGIDVTTKWDLYKRVREEAARGRSFLWYTTEYDELEVCDRVYVFYEGRITDEIRHAELSEDRVLKASFARVQADAA